MATRFPLLNTSSAVPMTPDWASSGLWNNANSSRFARRLLPTTQGNETITDITATSVTNSAIFRQFISQKLVPGQAVNGAASCSGQICASFSNPSGTLLIRAYIIGSNGTTIRKTLCSAQGIDFAGTTMANLSFSDSGPTGNYTTVSGDRVVIEIGTYRGGSTAGIGDHAMRLGYTSSGWLPTGTNSDSLSPWFQLDNFTLSFLNEVSATDSGSGSESGAALLISRNITAADSGHGTDSGAGLLTGYDISVSETGSGTNPATAGAAITATQLGTGSELGGSGYNLSSSDTGTGSETGIVGRSLFVTDSGSASEAVATTASIFSTQTGVGSASATVERADGADIATTQYGVGTQSAVADANIFASEAGAGAELGDIYAITDWFAVEFGTGHECAHPANDSSLGAETGIGTELAISGPWVTDVGVGASTANSDAAISLIETPTIIVTAVPGVLSDDTGAATDTGSSVVDDPFSDSGGGVDSGVVGASILASDSGLGGDAALLLADTLFEFSGAGRDFASALGAFTSSESAAGVDGLTMAHNPGQSDSGGGTEAASAVGGILSRDSGGGTEAASVQQHHSAGDTGAGVELLDPTADGVHVRFVSELGSGSEHGVACTIGENWSMDVDIVASDVGLGTDAGLQLFSASLADSGSGADALASGVAFISAETGTATDTGALGYGAQRGETGIGVDVATLDISPNFDAVASDAGIGLDALALVGNYSAADVGSATVETASVGIVTSQSGTGVDSANGVRTVAEPPESITVNLFSVRTVELLGSPRRVDLFSSHNTPAGQK